MLISRECFRDIYLDGKDEATIREQAVKIRNEILRLKRIIESPSYIYETHPFPDEYEMLRSCRAYLSEVYTKLEDMGLSPEYTAEELLVQVIEANVPLIRKVSLIIGVYLESSYELRIYGDHAKLQRVCRDIPSLEVTLDRDKVLAAISDMRIGEWHDSYTPDMYESNFNEPIRWRLLIEYNDEIAPKLCEGMGVFPYNFSDLRALLGAEE